MAQPSLLIIDDDAALCESLAETVADLDLRVVTASSGRLGLARIDAEKIDAVIVDMRLAGDIDGIGVLKALRTRPDPPRAAVLTAFASAENTIEAMRLGAVDHLTKPIGREDLRALVRRLLALAAPQEEAAGQQQSESAGESVLIGAHPAMREVQKAIGLAAASAAAVLIQGETGAGKELVARALHRYSDRAGRAFVAVNCAAIPADLLESELFGHVKGAFTGATADREGAFRQADGGSLFLDEIGDMPLAMQAKILRVLQDGVVTPVGGKPVATNVRVLAATHQPLAQLVERGAFRRDLFFRLAVLPINLPPLRERTEDIPLLAAHFLDGSGKRLAPAALQALAAHGWPGNVRELRNVIERLSVTVPGATISAEDVGAALAFAPAEASQDWLAGDLPGAVARLESEMIRRALAAAHGNRAEAARRLKINRQLLYAKMQRYGLAPLSEMPTSDVRIEDNGD